MYPRQVVDSRRTRGSVSNNVIKEGVIRRLFRRAMKGCWARWLGMRRVHDPRDTPDATHDETQGQHALIGGE
jgi:hypothetical protein